MRVHFDMDWLTKVLLVSVRIAALLWATPIFALGRVPAQVKLLAVIAFSAALSTLIEAPVPQRAGELVVAALAELGIGAVMAFGLHCAFGALQFGGRLLDLQMGYGIANLINPSSDEQEPLLGTVLLAVGVMTFYLIDAHHWLVRGVVQSYQWLPLGVAPGVAALDALLAQFGLMFTLGTVLVAPIIAVLLMLDVGLAMAGRTMPQLNVFMLSIPVKIAVGLLMLAVLAPSVGGALERLLESIFQFWQRLAQH